VLDSAAPAGAALEPVVRPPRITLSAAEAAGPAARNALKTGLEALRFHQPAAAAGEVEAIHQFRVANRRLRAAVELFAAVLHGSRVSVFRRELPWLGATAGATRECDVTEQLIRDRAARLDSSSQVALGPIFENLSAIRREEHGKVAAMFASKRYRLLLDRIATAPVRKLPPAVTVREMAPAMLRPLARSAIRAGSKLDPGCPPEVLHRLRIRTKRLRYALEMMGELGGKRVRKAVQRLTAMQDLLGLHNDAVVAITWLRNFAGNSSAPPATLLAAGALVHSIHRRQNKLAARSLKRWKKLERDSIIAAALAEVARNSRPQDQPPAVGDA
jgi:CHAD domain-containing protein